MSKYSVPAPLDGAFQRGESRHFSDRYLVKMLGRFLRPYVGSLVAIFAMLLLVTLLSLTPPYLIQRAVDGPIASGDLNGLVPLGIVYFSMIVLVFALRFAYTYLLQTVGQNALMSIRQSLFEHILKQDMRFFNTTPVGQLVSRLSNDIDALTELLSTSIVMVVSNFITLIGIIAVMLLINWRLALLSLAVMPVLIFVTVKFRGSIRRHAGNFHKIVGEYQAFLNEHLGGMLIVQLFGRQSWSRGVFGEILDRYRDTHSSLRNTYTAFASSLQLLTTLGLALVLWGGGQGVLSGIATLGMLIAFIQYTQRSFEPVLGLSEQFAQIQTAFAAGERVARMFAVEPGITFPANPAPIPNFRGAVTFEGVHFSYDPGVPVLQGINLHIPAGQHVAIVGATGAGKTSLAGLLARFYDVDQGRVLLDGVDLRQLSAEDLRRCVAVVPQNPYSFNGTIGDNLRLFDPTISLDQMREAARLAGAAGFIERLPQMYDYQLLPGGANLSQGQRQLLALARALIHSPAGVLVLDEATSSIDTETEKLIQEGLSRVLVNRTSLIIAHRLSTVRDADRILVMSGGRIVEDGNHETLLALNGIYTDLYQRQFIETEAEAF